MRNQIRKLILEAIGNSKEEAVFFGKDFVKKLKDSVFLDVLPIEGDWSEYMMRLDYIVNDLDLELVGDGFFRHVFKTGNPDILLKVATDRWTPVAGSGTLSAVQANLQEVGRFNKYPQFFPKSYAYDKDGVWILVEKMHKVYETQYEFYEGFNKNFAPVRDFSKNITNAILAYSHQIYQHVSQQASQDELDAFDFQRFMSDVDHKINEDLSGSGYKSEAFNDNAKKELFFDMIRSGIEKGVSYEEAISEEIKPRVEWIFNELKIHWVSAYLRQNTESDTDYGYFKFANTVLDKRIVPMVIQYVEDAFRSDKKSRDFFIMMQREKISLFDIRDDNTGETKDGQFKIIDATTF